MADKQIVPYNYAAKTLAPIEEQPDPLAIIPPPKGIPEPSKPRRPPSLPPPQGQRQAFYAQPVATKEERLRREAELKKPIKVPAWMDIKKPRTGETLVGVKRDEHGNMREHRYSTDPHVTIDSIRARPKQIKKIPMMEAAQRMSKQKNKRTVSDLTREMDYYRQTSLDI
jgi:hypothetical protein